MRDQLTKAMKDAMRNKEEVRLSTIRLMLAALKDREVALRSEDNAGDLDTAECHALFAKMVKQRQESISTYEEAGRMELAERERIELKVIREFLPKPLSGPEIEAAIKAAISGPERGFGRNSRITLSSMRSRSASSIRPASS
ncbi:MAG: GatB/YqeY domain-containing protein [Pseudomonadota bacterium]